MSQRSQARTKTDLAHEQLRRAIITFEIQSGQPLDEEFLTSHFEFGRTPLREALKRLALERLVIAPPHSTPYVRAVSIDELQTLYETRLLLEVPVCGRAAERISARELEVLEETLISMQAATAATELYDAVELNFSFHFLLASATQNRFLAEAINQLNRSSLRLWYLANHRLGAAQADAAHGQILQALRNRNRTAAEGAMREHIENSQQRVARALVFNNDVATEDGSGLAEEV